jgi:diguanylate cyclase (GGDEF)-like protein/putative nucleotidyltransferase with HDIG domain
MGEDPQLGRVSTWTRITLILWGVGGIGFVLVASYRLQSIEFVLFGVFLLVVVLPVFAFSYYSYRLYLRTLEKVQKNASDMGDLFNSTLSTLALAIDAKDKGTHGHTERVQKYAHSIAQKMNLDAQQIKAIAAAALLHDIGKLAIPEYILTKQGPLTPEEMRKMRMHPQFGADIISNIKFPYPVSDSILSHHERFDGEGYPRGLAGKEIPLGARVLAVADAFDGYISDRIESAETLDGAIRLICEGAGTAFDPEIVAVWERIYRDVVMWPSSSEAVSHSGIQQAKSELNMLESLVRSIEGLTSVHEIFFTVRSRIAKSIANCSVSLERGERPGIPVVFGGKVIATICVDRPKEGLNEDEYRLAHAIATRIAPTLSNAIAIEEARREAMLDKLTGLPNRRAFEVISASLHRQHFSIVLIDVNSFKAVNDNFGHNAGDATLIRVAAHLRAAFNDAHLACRLGGDEFLILSFASIPALRAQIRRFRQMVVWDPAHEAYRGLLFGVSCGLASIPADGQTVEHTMQCADERMYAIKSRFKQFANAEARPAQRNNKQNVVLALKR